MIHRCRSLLTKQQEPGFSAAGRKRLLGNRRQVGHVLPFTRAMVIRYRSEVVDRMSISGVQDKISLRYQVGEWRPTDTNGTYILKPIPGAVLPLFQGDVPANEHVTMQIAGQVFGIDTAANGLLELADGESAYLTRRFDRSENGLKLDMEDFCAIALRGPASHGRNYKYDGSYEEIGQLIHRHCPAAMVEIEKLFKQVVFCYAFGNGDAHLKNFSMLRSADGDPVLTPAYDLVNTSLHIPDEERLALDLFSDDFETEAFRANGFYTGADFRTLAARLGMLPQRADRILAAFIKPSNQIKAQDLVRHSFLSTAAQERYVAIMNDRAIALQQ